MTFLAEGTMYTKALRRIILEYLRNLKESLSLEYGEECSESENKEPCRPR